MGHSGTCPGDPTTANDDETGDPVVQVLITDLDAGSNAT